MTIDKVLASPKMPTLPAVAVKLLELTRDPEVDLGDIADVVQYDPALSGKILKTVNSSYYRLAQPCPTIKRALAYLGLSTVKSLVLGFSLVDLTRHCDENFDLLDYWRRCVYSAAAARRIALVTGRCDPDEAFIAALMQDVGMLALHAVLGAEYDRVVSETNGNHLALPHCETEMLGYTHADAGAMLGERWCLPRQLVDPIRQHHHRGMPLGDHRDIINAVILAYRISNLVATEHHKHVLDMISAMSNSMFRMSAEDERSVLLMITDDVRELSDLLDVHLGSLPDIEAILAEADEALVRHELEARPGEPPRGEAPAREALTDQLTGAGNRKRFDGDLAARFREASEQRHPLGLILVDTDRFKSLHDNLGDRVGEVVLQAIAHRLRAGVGAAGLVYRYGGESFAVVLPGASRLEAARMAERLRRQIETDSVDLRSVPTTVEAVQVTASLGVAALEPALAAQLGRPQGLVQLADKALYAAKRDGRNCVRVFTPKPAAPRRSDAA